MLVIIVATGDLLLGGDDFDQVIINCLIENIAVYYGVDLANGHPENLQAF